MAPTGTEKEFILNIPMNEVLESPFQGRFLDFTLQNIDNEQDNKINELAKSIENSGLLQPIVVRTVWNGYELIDGHRRYLACKKLGWKKIKAIVKDIHDTEAQINSIVGNLQRENLSTIELAIAYKKLLDADIFKDKRELSKVFGKDETYVGDLLHTLDMDARIIDYLSKKHNIKDLRLLRLIRNYQKVNSNGFADKQWELFNQVIAEGLSRAEVAEIVKRSKEPKKMTGFRVKKNKNNLSFSVDTRQWSDEKKDNLVKWLDEVLGKMSQ